MGIVKNIYRCCSIYLVYSVIFTYLLVVLKLRYLFETGSAEYCEFSMRCLLRNVFIDNISKYRCS